MAVMAIMGLILTAVFRGSEALLPQTRLTASASHLGGSTELARMTAVLNQAPIVFAYDLDRHGFKAYYPFELDDDGNPKGAGETPVLNFQRIEKGMEIREIRLPGTEPRTGGEVALTITPLGRMTPHDVIVHNPDYPETEVLTLRVSGLQPGYVIEHGDEDTEVIDDATFR